MRVLLDTHALVWWIASSERLTETARRLITDEATDVVVSAASAWEITTKFRIGKLPGAQILALDVMGHIARQGFRGLPISVADAERAGRLPGPHRDPFDRMLVAQAQVEGLILVTRDARTSLYGIRTMAA